MILDAIKEVLLCFFPVRAMYEAMIKYDFKIENPRKNLLQLCLAPLAAWPFFLLLLVIYFDPTKCAFSLQSTLGPESMLTNFLLSGQIENMWIIGGTFFLIEWIFRREYLFLALLFYFVAKADVHIHLATAAVIGTFIARAFYLWWFHITLESQTRKTWKLATSLQCISTITVSIAVLFALDYLQRNHYFSSSITANRFEFSILSLLSYYVSSLVVLLTWGHFYSGQRLEPSFLPVHYSTETWLYRFSMRPYITKLMKDKIRKALPEHLQSVKHFDELKDQSPGLGMNHLGITLTKETGYLQSASSRLTIE